MRGEYFFFAKWRPTNLELPPRARRIPLARMADAGADGTTSACAENTAGSIPAGLRGRNYLRVRGEYPK